jgi:hypothetical protein
MRLLAKGSQCGSLVIFNPGFVDFSYFDESEAAHNIACEKPRFEAAGSSSTVSYGRFGLAVEVTNRPFQATHSVICTMAIGIAMLITGSNQILKMLHLRGFPKLT